MGTRLRLHAIRFRLQREMNAAARVLINGALQVHVIHVQRTFAAIVHDVVEPTVCQPIVARRVRGAVLQINQNGWRRIRDVAGNRIVVRRAGIYGFDGIVRGINASIVGGCRGVVVPGIVVVTVIAIGAHV